MNEDQINALVERKFNERMVEERAVMLLAAQKASAATPMAIGPHGYNALWNQPGVEPGVISTIVKPVGLEAYLESIGHVQKSQFLNPVFEVLTGQTASSGEEPTEPCSENVPIPGDLKVCHQTWPFGEMTMKSKVIRVDNAGELINRSEPLDLRLLNNPFADMPQVIPSAPVNIFRNKLAKAVVELSLDFKRRYARLFYTGNPANTIASTGGYLEYNGLDRIVQTGYADAFTDQACAAVDSIILNRAGANIQTTSGATVSRYVDMYMQVQKLAQDLQINDVSWAFVMRYQKFLALTEVWPCTYQTMRCYTAPPSGSTAQIMVDGSEAVKMREDMRGGHYLMINGDKVPVVIDNTMAETNIGSGVFQSDTYLLPLKSATLGGQLLYVDYFDYNGPFGMRDVISQLGPQDEYRVSNDGRFAIFFMAGLAFCKQVMVRTRKRIILRAPFLAVKIEDEQYAAYFHEREWENDTSFFVDGGRTSYGGTSFYNSP